MEQHPIPQQISSYEFKLVGEMTLKQFLKAGAGIVLALLINSTKLVFFIKWPLMFVLGAGGLALAFIPFQDRPLETWLKAFIRSIYSPTIFIFRKTAPKNWLDLDLTKTTTKAEPEETEQEELPVKDKLKVAEFVGSLPSVKKEKEANSEQQIVNSTTEPEKIINKDQATTKTTKPVTEVVVEADWRAKKADLGLKTQRLEATGKVEFGEIPMPDIPEIANLVVGMVTDKNGKIVEGAIVEIQDEAGNPTRVFKTNLLGQFRTSTPLANGRYLVVAEKEGISFNRVNIDLKGEIVEPIKIIATG